MPEELSMRSSLPGAKFSLALGRWGSQTRAMKVEHVALQVSEPAAMADWYVKNLGCSVARSGGGPAHARFLLDGAGAVMLELYRSPQVPVPDYSKMDPQLLHVAFISEKVAADRDRLVKAGAKVVENLITSPLGDELVMLRDPWGMALQLVKRASPMV
jgi:glyoxylase I family protein